MQPADGALLNQILYMDAVGEAQLETMIREHSRFLYRVAYSVLRNHQDAEDAVQETFLRATRHRRELRLVEQPRAWLAKIAWRAALNRRRGKPFVSLDDAAGQVNELYSNGLPADEIAISRQMLVLLEQLISRLPSRLREVLVLSTVEEMSSVQIAGMLGLQEVARVNS